MRRIVLGVALTCAVFSGPVTDVRAAGPKDEPKNATGPKNAAGPKHAAGPKKTKTTIVLSCGRGVQSAGAMVYLWDANMNSLDAFDMSCGPDSPTEARRDRERIRNVAAGFVTAEVWSTNGKRSASCELYEPVPHTAQCNGTKFSVH